MRSIGTRQFQQNFHKEIKKLPFAVTRYGKVLFYVSINNPEQPIPQMKSPPTMRLSELRENTVHQIVQEPKTEEGHPVTTAKCEAPQSNCKAFGPQYRITYFDSEGEHTEDRYLCKPHLKRARETCEKVEEI